MSIDVNVLKNEREQLTAKLRDLEVEQRELERSVRDCRNRELQTKRLVEALSTLIDVQEVHAKAAVAVKAAPTASTSAASTAIPGAGTPEPTPIEMP